MNQEMINMTTAGWAFMIISWAFITALCAYCIFRILTSKKRASEDVPPKEE